MKKFNNLLKAIRNSDQKTIERLRQDWNEIRAYVDRHNISKVDLPDTKRPALILWLSTPPTPKPIDWADLTAVPSFVLDEREKQLAVVDQLWGAWSSGTIVQELDRGLRTEQEFVHDEAWLKHAKEWFSVEGVNVSKETKEDKQTRLDVVSGYGAFVDQLLVERRQPRSEAQVAVLGFERPPVLAFPEGVQIPVTALGEAIQFRSGLKLESATRLAYAISLSLPAHREVLPTVAVEMDTANCWLKPDWQVPALSS